MTNLGEQVKINLNQNLWGLVIGLAGLGVAEHFKLSALFWLSLLVSLAMIASVWVTTLAYTLNYWKNKKSPRKNI